MWAVIRQAKDCWQIHSVHPTLEVAAEWVRCLMHEAAHDYQLLRLTKDDCQDIVDAMERHPGE